MSFLKVGRSGIAVLVALLAFGQRASATPDPNQMLTATSPPVPTTASLRAIAARQVSVRYPAKLRSSVPNLRSYEGFAPACMMSWSLPSKPGSIAAVVTLNWAVHSTPAAAKFAAIASTWGPGSAPPKPSMSKGGLTGKRIGEACWHSQTKGLLKVVTCEGRVVVQITYQPVSHIVDGKVRFDAPSQGERSRLDTLAVDLIQRTKRYLIDTHQ